MSTWLPYDPSAAQSAGRREPCSRCRLRAESLARGPGMWLHGVLSALSAFFRGSGSVSVCVNAFCASVSKTMWVVLWVVLGCFCFFGCFLVLLQKILELPSERWQSECLDSLGKTSEQNAPAALGPLGENNDMTPNIKPICAWKICPCKEPIRTFSMSPRFTSKRDWTADVAGIAAVKHLVGYATTSSQGSGLPNVLDSFDSVSQLNLFFLKILSICGKRPRHVSIYKKG